MAAAVGEVVAAALPGGDKEQGQAMLSELEEAAAASSVAGRSSCDEPPSDKEGDPSVPPIPLNPITGDQLLVQPPQQQQPAAADKQDGGKQGGGGKRDGSSSKKKRGSSSSGAWWRRLYRPKQLQWQDYRIGG